MTEKVAGGDPSHVVSGYTILWINEVTPGRVDEYLELSKEALEFYPKHGVRLLGCWVGTLGAKSNQVLFLIDYKDAATYNELYSDPEFVKLHVDLGAQAMRSNTGWLLNPVDLSPVEFVLT
jgi:hypothetical protein